MTERQTLIETLEEAISHKDLAARAELLRAITQLFTSSCSRLSDEHVALFDDVMGQLLNEIDHSARAAFGIQLAEIPNAPPKIIHALALDDSIEVAGPILSRSERLDETSLVESAKTKSQDHLLAISRRHLLGDAVTDVLVERGDQQVAISVAANLGAKFSEFGYLTLVERAQNDSDLALGVLSRPEIPRQHLLSLVNSASESVRRKLEATDPRKVNLIREIVAQASDRIQATSREGSAAFVWARSQIESLHFFGKLSEAQLFDFARANKFDETIVAMSLICKMPFGIVERAIVNDDSDQLLVLAKSIGLSWKTTQAILLVHWEDKSRFKQDIAQLFATFTKLRPETAKKAVQFYRLREKSQDRPADLKIRRA